MTEVQEDGRVVSLCHKEAWVCLEQAAKRLEQLLEAEGALFDEVSGEWRFVRRACRLSGVLLEAYRDVEQAQAIIEGLELDLPC